VFWTDNTCSLLFFTFQEVVRVLFSVVVSSVWYFQLVVTHTYIHTFVFELDYTMFVAIPT